MYRIKELIFANTTKKNVKTLFFLERLSSSTEPMVTGDSPRSRTVLLAEPSHISEDLRTVTMSGLPVER